MRRARTSTTAEQSRGRIVDAISIRERPAEVEDRAVPGHWEGDLISGSNNSHIATLVERHTRFTKLVKVEGKDATTVATALSRQVRTLPMELRQTLTWDRGTEMAQHKRFTMATNVKVSRSDQYETPRSLATCGNERSVVRRSSTASDLNSAE